MKMENLSEAMNVPGVSPPLRIGANDSKALQRVKEEICDQLMNNPNPTDEVQADNDDDGEEENSPGQILIFKLFDQLSPEKSQCKLCLKVLTTTLGRLVNIT